MVVMLWQQYEYYLLVITPFGVLLLVCKLESWGQASTLGTHACKQQQQTEGVIIDLLIVAR